MAKDNPVELMDEIQEHADGDLLKAMLEVLMRHLMEEGATRYIGADRHERTGSRRGYRNGYKRRGLNTRVGKLELEVPEVRGTEPYSPLFFAKWQRSERALLVACAEMYYMGVSTRKVKDVFQEMGGFELSASTVSCVTQELDEKIAEFRQRHLDGHTWPYLMVDAHYVKVCKSAGVQHQAVLVVAGVNDAGRREILTWRLADVESEDTRGEVFRELKTTWGNRGEMGYLRWPHKHPGRCAPALYRCLLATLLDSLHAQRRTLGVLLSAPRPADPRAVRTDPGCS